MLALTEIPYQRSWGDELQKIQLKREVAGTSRIEGAEFTEKELDAAMRETAEQLETRSQRQAAAALAAYRWIAALPADRPIDEALIREVHRTIITGCDDLTPFLAFGLRGIETQWRRLFAEIRDHIKKALFRNTVTDLFGRLRSPRKRVMTGRHVQILNLLLDKGELSLVSLIEQTRHLYILKNPQKALVRDLYYLIELEAMRARQPEGRGSVLLSVNLEWPTQITETEFFRRIKAMPKGKVHGFLSS